jgi:hypothetical protein
VSSLAHATLGYSEGDLRRLTEMAGGEPLTQPQHVRRVLDNFQYLDDWRLDYRIQSVKSSLNNTHITCIDGAILSYGLLELLFPNTKRRLLAIHRRDPKKDEECGHCVTLYWTDEGRIGAFSKSSFKGLGHRDAVYADETAIATSFAEAYVDMGFQPLYFGVSRLEEVAPDIDWRYGQGALNEISSLLQGTYEYGFAIEQKEDR